jgi:hypothetical protein
MTISKPSLPPKAGYVEVEVDGVRTYRNVSTGVLVGDEVPAPTLEQRVADLEVQLQQADEAAIELYEAQLEINAAQDDALIELYEMMGG